MSDGQLVLIVLVALLFYECLRWVPGRAWIWQSRERGSWRGSRPWRTFQTKGGALSLLHPLPPPEAHVVSVGWPCAPHAQGLCVWDEMTGTAIHLPWAEIKPLAAGAVLRLTGSHGVRCQHATSASAWADTVKKWTGLTQAEREADFQTRVSALLDPEGLVSAAKALQHQTRWLRVLGGSIFWWTFFAAPVCYWRFGDQWPTFVAVGSLLAFMILQAVLLFRQVRRHAALRRDGLAHLLGAALLPTSSMRAADWVCAELSPEAHPLAALRAWGREEDIDKVAAEAWRRARWPAGDFPQRPWDGPEVEALRTFFQKQDIDSVPFEAAPSPQEGCTKWCPRCLTQYSRVAETCGDCSGVRLLELP